MKTIPQNTQSFSCFVIDCILYGMGCKPWYSPTLVTISGLYVFTDGEKMTVTFLAPILYLKTLRAETLRSARRVVPTASLAEVLNLIQGFANDTQLYTSFTPNNDLELADTSAEFQDDCEI